MAWSGVSFLEQRAYSAAQAALIQSRQDEQVRLEALVRERTQTLQDAVIAADEANRARSELLARVNQDLCRPATRIVALAQSLEQAGGEHAAQGAAIRRSASDLQGLIDDLIEEAGAGQPLGAIRPEPVDIRRLLEGLATEAEGSGKGQRQCLQLSARSRPAAARAGRPKRLRQILINLLDNAAKFTRAGRVELRVDAVETAGLAMLTFTVSDTGIGMTAEQLAEVFEPYRRAAGAGGLPGLGLGLAIARHWIERMDGSIGVDSAPGRGTTMRVALSLSLPDSSPAVPEPAGASVPTAALPVPMLPAWSRRCNGCAWGRLRPAGLGGGAGRGAARVPHLRAASGRSGGAATSPLWRAACRARRGTVVSHEAGACNESALKHGAVLLGRLLLALCLTGSLSAQAFQLDAARQRVDLAQAVYYLEDPAHALTLQDVGSPEFAARFRRWDGARGNVNFGYSASAYWLRLCLARAADAPDDWLLELSYPLLNELEFAAPGRAPVRTGSAYPLASRELPDHYFVFRLRLDQQLRCHYLRVASQEALILPLLAWQPAAL